MTTKNLEPKAIIADQIRSEWEAVRDYSRAADNLAKINLNSFSDIISLLNDISDEEAAHVGELQQAMRQIDSNVGEKITDGKAEAEEILAKNEAKLTDIDTAASNLQKFKSDKGFEANIDNASSIEDPDLDFIDTEITELTQKDFSENKEDQSADTTTVTNIQGQYSNEIKEIEDFVNELYDLRKNGLQSGGEYSQDNLIFKEFRNRGYLDELKDLKTALKQKQMSIKD